MTTAKDRGGREGGAKPHAEHLRTTHLGLVALCFTLLVVWATRERGDYERALDQLRAMRSASSTINKDPFWLDLDLKKAAEAASSASTAKRSDEPLWLPPNDRDALIGLKGPAGRPRCFHLQIRAPYSLLPPRAAAPSILDPPRVLESPANLPRLAPLFEPKTIADFEWLWESCREPLVIHYPVGLAYRYIFAPEAGDTQSGDWTESSPGCPGGVDEDAACHPKLIPTTHFSGAAPFDFDYVLTGPCDRPGTGALVGRIAIPAATGSVAFDALPRLQRFFAQWAPQPGPYGRAFPELSSLSRRFRNETFEVAEQILQGVRDQTAASHQVLGVSVPADSVSFLGIIVLLSAQWYFVVQLAEFAERVRVDASVWDVAWVGLYPALSARFLFVASAMLAPPLMTLLLGRKRGDWVTATLGLGVSAFLSVMAWRSWTQARQHRPGQDEVKT